MLWEYFLCHKILISDEEHSRFDPSGFANTTPQSRRYTRSRMSLELRGVFERVTGRCCYRTRWAESWWMLPETYCNAKKNKTGVQHLHAPTIAPGMTACSQNDCL